MGTLLKDIVLTLACVRRRQGLGSENEFHLRVSDVQRVWGYDWTDHLKQFCLKKYILYEQEESITVEILKQGWQGVYRMDTKNIKIDEEIIQRTNNCERNFCCLSGDKTRICKAKCSIGFDLLEINPTMVNHCRCRVSFGNTYFCNCPTRKEIYNRYNI